MESKLETRLSNATARGPFTFPEELTLLSVRAQNEVTIHLLEIDHRYKTGVYTQRHQATERFNFGHAPVPRTLLRTEYARLNSDVYDAFAEPWAAEHKITDFDIETRFPALVALASIEGRWGVLTRPDEIPELLRTDERLRWLSRVVQPKWMAGSISKWRAVALRDRLSFKSDYPNLKDLRIEAGLTQEGLAEKIGITADALSRSERKHSPLRPAGAPL